MVDREVIEGSAEPSLFPTLLDENGDKVELPPHPIQNTSPPEASTESFQVDAYQPMPVMNISRSAVDCQSAS